MVKRFTLAVMNKHKVILLFGGVDKLATALGVSRHAVYMMPDFLSQRTFDRIVGASIRAGIDPAPLLEAEHDHSVESNAPKKDAA